MFSTYSLLSEEQFLCSICLDVFTHPVTIPCGHNFCKKCITQHWDVNVQCQCPMCKDVFDRRPELRVNTFISEMAAQFRQSAVNKASSCSVQKYANSGGDVLCDVCTGTKLKALKSCLTCLASYCETHLEPHHRIPGLKRHTVIDPVENLEERMCKKHDRPFELYCKTDQMCVCLFCTESDHKPHVFTSVVEEYKVKKAKLEKVEDEIQQMIQERRLKIQEIKQSVKLSQEDADRETAESVEIFTVLIQSVQKGLAQLKDPAVHQSYQQLRLKTRQGLRQLLYHCPTCNRRFKNQLERERHLLVHGPQRPFACHLCDHAATKMAALAAHVRKHLFLYVCCVCDGKFVSSQRLEGHLKESHTELDQEQVFTDCINNSYYLMQPEGGMWGDEEREDPEEGMKEEHRIEQEDEEERTREEGGKNDVGGEEHLELAASKDREQGEEGEGVKSQGESAEELQVINGVTGKGSQQGSQEVLHEVISMETTTPSDRRDEATAEEKSQDGTDSHPPEAEENTQTFVSPGINHTPLLDDRTQENTHPAPPKNSLTSSSSGNTDSCDLDGHTHLSSTPPDDRQTPQSERNAFQQVFSSLQKTRLNMESFQRLRKIYGDLECQYCGKLFWYKVHYNVHVRTHTKEHSHYCSKCSYSSITKSSLKRHQIQKHSGLLLPCSNPGCKYTTSDKYKLQAHLRTHQEQGKSVTCPVCQHSYPEHRLKHHIKTSHPGLTVQRAEKCPYCDSYFLKNSSDFQRHIWAHQGLKPYVCNVCDYAGRSRSNLKTHMNRHNTERRHLCDLCGKKFKSKVTLKSHRLSHTDEGKRFHCSECDFTSVSKPSLLRHMEQHAEFKPFRCAHCHYSCNIAGPLKRHYNMKHPDQKYHNAGPGLPNPEALKQQGGVKCPECEFVYGTKWELNRHLKSKHSLKVVEGTWEVGEAVEAQYVPVEDEEQLTESPVSALQDNVNIQQITEFSSETHDAITSMVAMAPGTVTVVQQLQVADEQEVGNCSNQLMVVNADGGLTGDQVMVVEEAHGLEALTVLTQGENTHHYIVYVQEHTVEIN